MQVGKLAILLTLCAFSVDATASNSRAVNIPLDWLLNEDPSIQIRNISDREVEWFNTYFKAVKDSGRSLNTRLKFGETLLHFAVKEGSVNMVKALLAAEVDAYQPNNEGVTAVEFAHGLADENDEYEEIWNIFKEAGYEIPESEDEEEGDDQQGEDMQGSYNGDSEDGENQENHEESDEDQEDDGSMDIVDPAQEVTSSSSANANASSPTRNSGPEEGMDSPAMSADAGIDLDFDPIEISNILSDYSYETKQEGVIMDTSAPPAAVGVPAGTADAQPGSLLNSTAPLPVPSRYVINFPLLVQVPADKLVPGVQYTVI